LLKFSSAFDAARKNSAMPSTTIGSFPVAAIETWPARPSGSPVIAMRSGYLLCWMAFHRKYASIVKIVRGVSASSTDGAIPVSQERYAIIQWAD
jgi:hypothetical protein